MPGNDLRVGAGAANRGAESIQYAGETAAVVEINMNECHVGIRVTSVGNSAVI
jgi:hypothetical protein